ncbi:MAG: cell division protein FtsK, partial [Actinobacteria bacterium]
MAGRTSQASRGRKTSPARGASTARARSSAAAKSRATAASRRRSTGPGLAVYIGRLIAALWMGLANSLGWLVRAIGRQAATARDLDPGHRRDGAGLLVFGLAILSAMALWFSSAGPLGARLADTARLFFGSVAAVLPVLLFVGAVRLMRQPAEPEHRGRGVVGWSALIVAVDGLLHLAQDPVDPAQRDYAGGLIGAGIGSLLKASVGAWVGGLLLVLLLLFGVLVVTATPINKIPERLGLLADVLLGREPTSTAPDGGDDEQEKPAPKRRRPARRRQASMVRPEPDEGEETPEEPETAPGSHPTVEGPASRQGAGP